MTEAVERAREAAHAAMGCASFFVFRFLKQSNLQELLRMPLWAVQWCLERKCLILREAKKGCCWNRDCASELTALQNMFLDRLKTLDVVYAFVCHGNRDKYLVGTVD